MVNGNLKLSQFGLKPLSVRAKYLEQLATYSLVFDFLKLNFSYWFKSLFCISHSYRDEIWHARSQDFKIKMGNIISIKCV